MKLPVIFHPLALVLVAALLLPASLSLSQTSEARQEMRNGLDAEANGRHEEAVIHFQAATRDAPGDPQAFLYLGAEYASNVIPFFDDPENGKTARQAIDALQIVLKLRPDDGLALRQLASTYFITKQDDRAREILLRIVHLAPNDFEAEYTIGAIDWGVAYRTARKRLEREKLTFGAGDYPTASASVCREIAAANQKTIAEALQHLNRAMELNPNYDDALKYLSLVYKLRAGTQCASTKDRAADLALARKNAEQALLTARQNSHPVESPQPASTLALPRSLAPSPPPPPPPPPPPLPPPGEE